MTTSITRSGNTQRLRLVTADEARAAGKAEAQQLLAEAFPADQKRTPADALYAALVEFIALAHDNRYEECDARLKSFCEVIGPVLYRRTVLSESLNQADRAAQTTPQKQSAVNALVSVYSLILDGRIISAHPNDNEAIEMLCELKLAARAMQQKFTDTESEGGEI